MKSKIRFDIDESTGKPTIAISYLPTDDVRDKLVGNFINLTQIKDCKLILKPDEYSLRDIGEYRFIICTE